MSFRHLVVDVFLWLGVVLTLVGCLGVVLMPTVYDRLHFTGPPILGAACIVVAAVVQESFSLIGDKSILIAVMLVILSPLLTHATGRAARVVEEGDWRGTDEKAAEL